MKNYVFILICYLFNYSFCEEYDLKIRSEESFDLEANKTYKFFISMKEDQKAKIILYIDETDISYQNPFSSIYINEYIFRNSPSIKKSEIYFYKYFDEDFQDFIFEGEYFSDEFSKNYINIEITPNISIKNSHFSIYNDISGGFYKMTNSEESFDYFFSGISYYFAKEADYGNKIKVLIEINKNEEFSFDKINLVEYKDNNHSIILESNNFKYSYITNIYKKIELSYFIQNYDTHLISVNLFPQNHTLNYFKISIYIYKYFFDFGKRTSFNAFNIKSKNYLYFNLEGNKSQIMKLSISLNNNCTNEALKTLTVYETKNKFDSNYLKETNIELPSTKEKKILYEITSKPTKYLLLNFSVQCDIEQFNISYSLYEKQIQVYYFDLKNGVSLDMIDLFPDKNYYLFINSSYLKTLLISFIVDNETSKPFETIVIYENYDKIEKDYYQKETKFLTFDKNDEGIKSNLIYLNKDNTTSFNCLRIKPQYLIKSLKVKINVDGGIYYLKDGISTSHNSLIKGVKYFYSINIVKNKKVHITLKLNKESPYSSLNIIIHEKSAQFSYSTVKQCSFETKENELISSFDYEINNTNADTLILELEPENNLDYINTLIKFGDEEENTDLDVGTILAIVLPILGAIIIAAAIFIILKIRKNKMNSIVPKDEKELELNSKN